MFLKKLLILSLFSSLAMANEKLEIKGIMVVGRKIFESNSGHILYCEENEKSLNYHRFVALPPVLAKNVEITNCERGTYKINTSKSITKDLVGIAELISFSCEKEGYVNVDALEGSRCK